ncbi:MAG TPA: S-methyl-5-thioribose-1-phosphate isomerase [Ignavibacteriaceae bacterium]|nr:S-methyl-5-thioribose-1-phosphate isomerase [Ignavibacteriaceae bacterium]
MKKTDYFSLKFENDKFIFLDQTGLPFKEQYVETDSYERIAEAIEKLEIRGAPAIGIAAAYALALSVKNISAADLKNNFDSAYKRLGKTRPTAVNLFMALEEIKKTFDAVQKTDDVYNKLLNKAVQIHNDDIERCRRIGLNGLQIFRRKSNILTHCNTGKLATGGDGTAFNVIKTAFERGLVNYVYADETRPLLQGLRLTAFELEKNGIPFSVLNDSSASSLLNTGKVDFVITGADRIALNGDTANKIGTYNLAVSCAYHDIPFYIAAPTTTIDRKIATGDEIIIEFRDKNEITSPNGIELSPGIAEAYTPAFDVTPSHLISGIVTEEGVFTFPYNFLI